MTPGGSQEALIIAHHHCHACPRSMTIGTMGHQPHGCWQRLCRAEAFASGNGWTATCRGNQHHRYPSFITQRIKQKAVTFGFVRDALRQRVPALVR